MSRRVWALLLGATLGVSACAGPGAAQSRFPTGHEAGVGAPLTTSTRDAAGGISAAVSAVTAVTVVSAANAGTATVLPAATATGTPRGESARARPAPGPAAMSSNDDAFVRQLIRSGVELETLPRGRMAASMAPLPATFAEFRARAVTIVHGVVTGLDITPNRVTAEVRVIDAAKGSASPGRTIRFTTGELLTPDAGRSGGELGLLPTYPGLFTGDEGVFLVTDPGSGPEAINSADTLLVKGGVVVGDRSNPFDAAVRGSTPAELLARLRA